MGPAPPLNDKLFLGIVPDEVLHGVIANGRPGTPMPAFARDNGGALTPEQVDVLAGGLKTHWGKETQIAGVPTYLLKDAKDTAKGRPKEGLNVYRLSCAMCHREDGKEHKTESGKVIGPINNRSFLALISDQALRRIIITGRPDLGMPSYADTIGKGDPVLASQDVADLVALLAACAREKEWISEKRVSFAACGLA